MQRTPGTRSRGGDVRLREVPSGTRGLWPGSGTCAFETSPAVYVGAVAGRARSRGHGVGKPGLSTEERTPRSVIVLCGVLPRGHSTDVSIWFLSRVPCLFKTCSLFLTLFEEEQSIS